MKQICIIVITIFLFTESCTVTKPLTSNVKPGEITDLKLLEPYSYISKIKKGNRGQVDDSISAVSKQLVYKVLESYEGQIPLKGKIILTGKEINESLEKEYETLMLTVEKNKNVANITITPTLLRVLEANQTRFGLIIVSTGFTRVKGNYGKQVAKGFAIGLVTLGMYYETPIKAYSTIYAIIVDSMEKNIAFYRKSFVQDMEPLDEAAVTRQFRKIFEGYFIQKK